MYIIVGQGAAGTNAAVTLRRLDPGTPVTIISDERDYFYSRIDLPDIISGRRKPDDASLRTQASFEELGITCLMGETVKAVHPDQKTVELSSGRQLSYTKLLLATGSLPFIPDMPGIIARNVYSLWTMEQARQIIQASTGAQGAVVVGAGLIGLKTASALADRGLKVTVVEKMPRVMPRQLDSTASGIIEEHLGSKGITTLTGTGVTGITVSDGAVSAVELEGGKSIPCELVIMAIGVKPNTGLASAAGIAVRKGILTDACQQTSIPGIYAAGDAAETVDQLSGLAVVPAIWPVAVEQGQIAASGMAGRKVSYNGSLAMNSVEVAGVPIVSVGDIEEQAGDAVLAFQQGDIYRKIVLRDQKVRGILLTGDIRQAGFIGNLIQRKVVVDQAELNSPSFNYGHFVAI